MKMTARFILTSCHELDDLDSLSRCSHEALGRAEKERFSSEGIITE